MSMMKCLWLRDFKLLGSPEREMNEYFWTWYDDHNEIRSAVRFENGPAQEYRATWSACEETSEYPMWRGGRCKESEQVQNDSREGRQTHGKRTIITDYPFARKSYFSSPKSLDSWRLSTSSGWLNFRNFFWPVFHACSVNWIGLRLELHQVRLFKLIDLNPWKRILFGQVTKLREW